MGKTGKTRGIARTTGFWVVLIALLALPLRSVQIGLAEFGATASSSPANPVTSEDDHGSDAAATALDSDDAITGIGQRVDSRAVRPQIILASLPSAPVFAQPLGLRWRAANRNGLRGPPRFRVPARAPPFS